MCSINSSICYMVDIYSMDSGIICIGTVLFVFVLGRAQWSPQWSAWLELWERRLGKVTWTAVGPLEFSFALNTGYLFSYYILYILSYLFGVADRLSFMTELCSVMEK